MRRFTWLLEISSAALLLLMPLATLRAEEPSFAFKDANPQRYDRTARASKLDSRAKEHPEIDFVFEKDGKPTDTEHAMVDTRVAPQGKLVIWLMGYNDQLFSRISSYGLHAIQVHYANGWFESFLPWRGTTTSSWARSASKRPPAKTSATLSTFRSPTA